MNRKVQRAHKCEVVKDGNGHSRPAGERAGSHAAGKVVGSSTASCVIAVPRKLGQEDLKLETSLGCTARP